jgi:hypothetical protein
MTHRRLVRNASVLGVSAVVRCLDAAPQPAAAAAGSPVHVEAVTSFEEER